MPILTEGFLVIHRSTQPTETLQVLLSNLHFHGGFTEVFTGVGVPWVAKMQYALSP